MINTLLTYDLEELDEFIIISEDNNKINEFEWNFLY